MKSFFKGIFGALLVLLAAAIIVPQYSDYRAADETSSCVNEIAPTKDAISANVIRLNKDNFWRWHRHTQACHSSSRPLADGVTDSGTIFLKGGRDGQFVALIPTFSSGNVSWRCIGGSSRATLSCKHGP